MIGWNDCIVLKYPKKGEAELNERSPTVEVSENNAMELKEEAFKVDWSILRDSLKVPTNWISISSYSSLTDSFLPTRS